MDKTGRLGTPQDKAGNHIFSLQLSSPASGLNDDHSRLTAERCLARILFRLHNNPHLAFIIIPLIKLNNRINVTTASFYYIDIMHHFYYIIIIILSSYSDLLDSRISSISASKILLYYLLILFNYLDLLNSCVTRIFEPNYVFQ